MWRQPPGDVAKQWLRLFLEGCPHRRLEQRSLRLVEAATNCGAEVDHIRGSRAQPRLIAPVRRPEVEDVEGVPRPESERDVDAAQLGRKTAVFVLGIDHVDLDPA